MRASQIFLPPYKKTSNTLRTDATRLLSDGGFVRKIADGLYAYLPLGMLVMRNLGQMIAIELKRLGGQEILLPLLNPPDLWEATGRDRLAADEILLATDKSGHTWVLAPTHEEAMVALLRDLLREDWQLPAFFFQTQVKVRDEDKASFGMLRPREFIMCDGYSVHTSFSDLNNFIPRVYRAFTRIFKICGLTPLVAEGSSFFLGGERSYDFLILQRGGDYRVVTCDACTYVADQQVAVGLSKISYGKLMPLTKGSRKDIRHFSDIGKSIGIPGSRIAKCIVYTGLSGFVMAVMRSDQRVSREKLARLVGDPIVGEVKEEDLGELGLVAEFLSPMGMDLEKIRETGFKVVIDPLVAETPNIVIGGNDTGVYYINANFGRDFEGHILGDISVVDERNRCYHCGGALRVRPALKLATIVRLNEFYTRRLGVSIRYESGASGHPLMGAYGIGMDRLLNGIVQSFQDDRGLLWPLQVAPYKAVLIVVGRSPSLQRLAATTHEHMADMLLWDDRPVSFSERIRDADRIGIPIRVVISAVTIKDNTVTFMYRRDRSCKKIPISRLKAEILDLWKTEREASGLIEDVPHTTTSYGIH